MNPSIDVALRSIVGATALSLPEFSFSYGSCSDGSESSRRNWTSFGKTEGNPTAEGRGWDIKEKPGQGDGLGLSVNRNRRDFSAPHSFRSFDMKKLFLIVASVVLAAIAYLAWIFLTLPDVASLARTNPKTTALMEQRAAERIKKFSHSTPGCRTGRFPFIYGMLCWFPRTVRSSCTPVSTDSDQGVRKERLG